MTRKRLLRLGRDLLVVGVVFFAISTWQTRDHLGAGAPVPAFEAARLSDGIVTPLPVAGRRTLVYFFAPWCSVCKVSAGNLATVRRWVGVEAADVVAVALDYEKADDVRRFVEDHDVGVAVLLGTEALGAAYRVGSYPTYYVLDAEGRVEHVSVGYSSIVGMYGRLVI